MNELTRFFNDLFTDFIYQPINDTNKAEKIHIEMELAGVKKEEIKISVEEGYLRIAVDSKKRNGSRIISLSKYHNTDNAVAKYEDGLLTIDIPLKKVEEKPKKLIEIK